MTADAWSRFTGGPTGYEVVDAGFKYNMTDLAASLALPQLHAVEENWKRRELVWQMYNERLSGLPLQLPAPPDPNSRHAYHLYTPLLKLNEIAVGRDKIVAAVDADGIGVGIHYVPVHQHPYYRQHFGLRDSDFPNASRVGERTISLPLTPAMSEQDVADVASALSRILRYYRISA
jgi:dTDP-4-amino-4,6-dideoxygalactose transaminase